MCATFTLKEIKENRKVRKKKETNKCEEKEAFL